MRAGVVQTHASMGAPLHELQEARRWALALPTEIYARNARRHPSLITLRKWPIRKAKIISEFGMMNFLQGPGIKKSNKLNFGLRRAVWFQTKDQTGSVGERVFS